MAVANQPPATESPREAYRPSVLRQLALRVTLPMALVALVLFGLWLAAMYSARVGSQERDVSMMIDPAELRRFREQAEARKAAASQDAQD